MKSKSGVLYLTAPKTPSTALLSSFTVIRHKLVSIPSGTLLLYILTRASFTDFDISPRSSERVIISGTLSPKYSLLISHPELSLLFSPGFKRKKV